jgi:glycosyltransferase involved in cell wall biosynthesis
MTDAAGSRGRFSEDGGPAVTVVTATYNSSATLRLALRSLLLQGCEDFEALVVGDACTDDSEQVVAALGDPRLRWVNLPHNSGSQAGPNNEGLRLARGEYVAYLGHDDLWFPWHLEGLLELARERRADLVHAMSAVLTPAGIAGVVGPPPRGQTYRDHFAPPSSWLHWRVGAAEWRDARTLGSGVDMDYLRRLHRAGGRIACLEQLSVLKFPSARWRMYDLAGSPPQLQYLLGLEEDATALQRRVLLEVAAAWARHGDARESPRELARRLVRTAARELLDLYGRDRWPVSVIWRWYFQRLRRRLRDRRGLPS